MESKLRAILPDHDLLKMYGQMVLCREFEEACAEQYTKGHITGFLHLYSGQEAVAVGATAALHRDDYILSAYREHAQAIVRGAEPRRVRAELFGKRTGICKGKGGSMHLFDPNLSFMGGYAIVGGQFPIAVGLAFAAKFRKEGRIVACFFGDGAANRGTFHESLNLASIWNLPIVFVCENNMYGISYCQRDHMNICDISDRASAYGIPGVTVDGNDVVAVYETTAEAVKRAKNGDGPSLIECKTWRWRGHFEGDPGTYKDPAEQAEWIKKDPIPRLANKLLELQYATQPELDRINASVNAQINAAVEFAQRSPDPVPADVLTDVFAN